MSQVCPKCQREDAIQKVSAIVLTGRSTATFSGPSIAVAQVGGKLTPAAGYTQLSGSTVTHLASLLAPPAKPKKRNPGGCYVLLGIWGLLAAVSMPAIFLSEPDMRWMAVFGIVWLVIGILAFRQASRESAKYPSAYDQQLKQWERAMSIWESTYYCFRDDLVFDSNTGNATSPQSLASLLFAPR
jgi:hypothetical protein